MIDIREGDCLDLMRSIPDTSIDLVLCDLPYGTTQCKWDVVIPFAPLWEAYKRIVKPRGAIVLTAAQPFTSALVMSNPKWFRHESIWDKTLITGFLDARRRPLRRHESILLFAPRGGFTYNPQKSSGKPYKAKPPSKPTEVYGAFRSQCAINSTGDRFPTSIIAIKNSRRDRSGHPSEKPVALFEHLIKTYSNEGETVLDNCLGSGTTAVACFNTGRACIGIEREPKYVTIARTRLAEAQSKLALTA